eukprot:TRINITY_DN17039_c1_g2_i1.p1 TRINITY_DN17039_c1_g2~~TRINITY_DN17039_c1_g2_i1.p1  ORF type:complete len:107 (-),score=14.57 TRINITY_DN17039_c1_g2_i1:489-809(-)
MCDRRELSRDTAASYGASARRRDDQAEGASGKSCNAALDGAAWQLCAAVSDDRCRSAGGEPTSWSEAGDHAPTLHEQGQQTVRCSGANPRRDAALSKCLSSVLVAE